MSGDIEINKCNFCGFNKPVLRFYVHASNTKEPFFIKYCTDCGEPLLNGKVPKDGDNLSPREHIEQAKKFLGEKL